MLIHSFHFSPKACIKTRCFLQKVPWVSNELLCYISITQLEIILISQNLLGGYHLHNAPPPMGMPSTSSDIHQQQSTSFSDMESSAYSHDPTHDITSTGDWLQMMASAKPMEDTNINLPYYVKKTGTTAVPSPKYPPSNMNGDCKSGVKNVLDGHVWTLEPEDPSNKVRISIFMSF